MKRLMTVLGLIALAGALALWVTRPVILPDGALPVHRANASKGEYLFHAGGCASCHSSTHERSEPAMLGGGLEMDTDFGVFVVPNISPHPTSGIGRWTRLQFVNAMLKGTSPAGRHYYPAFPYASYSRMSFEDLMDLKAYIDTLPAVESDPGDHRLQFPWNIRSGIGFWKLLNLNPEFVISIPAGEQQLVRGRYLVEGAGHCGECHTPRNLSGGLNNSRWMSGAPNPDGEGKVPNITPHKSGLSAWSKDDIAYYLASGFTPDFDSVGGSMVEVQENMAQLSEEDREAIAAYLKYIPPLD